VTAHTSLMGTGALQRALALQSREPWAPNINPEPFLSMLRAKTDPARLWDRRHISVDRVGTPDSANLTDFSVTGRLVAEQMIYGQKSEDITDPSRESMSSGWCPEGGLPKLPSFPSTRPRETQARPGSQGRATAHGLLGGVGVTGPRRRCKGHQDGYWLRAQESTEGGRACVCCVCGVCGVCGVGCVGSVLVASGGTICMAGEGGYEIPLMRLFPASTPGKEGRHWCL
jgi:hypothetical protein